MEISVKASSMVWCILAFLFIAAIILNPDLVLVFSGKKGDCYLLICLMILTFLNISSTKQVRSRKNAKLDLIFYFLMWKIVLLHYKYLIMMQNINGLYKVFKNQSYKTPCEAVEQCLNKTEPRIISIMVFLNQTNCVQCIRVLKIY